MVCYFKLYTMFFTILTYFLKLKRKIVYYMYPDIFHFCFSSFISVVLSFLLMSFSSCLKNFLWQFFWSRSAGNIFEFFFIWKCLYFIFPEGFFHWTWNSDSSLFSAIQNCCSLPLLLASIVLDDKFSVTETIAPL